MFTLSGMYAQRGLIRHQRSTNTYSGYGSSLNDYLSYRLLDGTFPGVIDVKASFGASFINGDLNGALFFPSFSSNNMISLQMNHIFPGNFGYVLSYMYGNYVGSDSLNSNRKYAYKSVVSEISIHAKYYILGGPYSNDLTHSLYVYGGFGVVISDAKSTSIKDPINTLGSWTTDNVKYTLIYNEKSTVPVFPVGIGYQYALTDNISIGAEIGGHFILGDYIEGLNPKPPVIGGNNIANDNIIHVAITLAFKLYRGKD